MRMLESSANRVPGILALVLIALLSTWASAQQTTIGRGSVVVTAIEDSSGNPIRGVDVRIQRPGWYVGDSHWEPTWSAYTDSTGLAVLERIPSGGYELLLCENRHERAVLTVEVVAGRSDTVRAVLKYVGPPSDGRRCEVRFTISGLPRLGKALILVTEAESGKPVVFANVTVLGAWRGGITDENGLVSLDLEYGLRWFKTNAIGRIARQDSLRVVEGKVDTLRLEMVQNPVQVQIDTLWHR